ncbi:MAG: filamentous hemagglutinin N-terminal domain-containing protein, partial [Elainellaceae cyanobacterium]
MFEKSRAIALPFVFSTLLLTNAAPAGAQITPDETLGAESSQVMRDVEVRGALGDIIEGGATRGSSLFHSFSEFNVNEFQRVYFSNPAGIEAILSRVTGGDISEIFGTLGVDGTADLFFLNPNGIVFGENAQLDIAGSFVASTADRFEFADGSSFSAVNPEAPPLLTVTVTPGLQYGRDVGARHAVPLHEGIVTNQGLLQAGQDLTLDAGNLNLQGQLFAGGDLILQAQDTVMIRDTVAAPFIASSGGELLVQGNQAVDIFALNHPDSGLWSGGDLVLRSGSPVIGDTHYWSGGNFRIEQLDESLGDLLSPNDPVIRAAGDVAFGNYTGASLHIFAGGSVTADEIEITDADPVNGIVEEVTLSDGSTVSINGQTTPTLDVRAGTLAVNPVGEEGDTAGFVPGEPTVGAGATGSGIEIASIRNEGGTVFLTNQYQPNLELAAGDIEVIGEIDTSVVEVVDDVADLATPIQVRGGDVWIDSRGGIELTAVESVNTSADVTVDITGVNDVGDIEVEATGGAIRLNAQDDIAAGNLNSSAAIDTSVVIDAVNDVADLATAIQVRGGDVWIDSRGGIKLTAVESVNTSADATVSIGEVNEFGDVEFEAIGGAIRLNAQDSIATGNLNSSAAIDAFVDEAVNEVADLIAAIQVRGGDVGIDSRGEIELTAVESVNTSADATVNVFGFNEVGDVEFEAIGGAIRLNAQGSIATSNLNSSAAVDLFILVQQNLDDVDDDGTPLATAGTIGDVTLMTIGGTIALESDAAITTRAIDANANANVGANAYAFAGLSAAGETIGNVTLTTIGGTIVLESDGAITTGAINADADAVGFARVYADAFAFAAGDMVTTAGGTIGDMTLTTVGGAIALESDAAITTGAIDAAVVANGFANARASVFGDDDVVAAAGGTIGDLTLMTIGGTIDLESDAAITTGAINAFASADADADANARASVFGDDDMVAAAGGTIGNVTLMTIGGTIDLESDAAITTGAINADADAVADVNAGAEARVYADADADADAGVYARAAAAGGTIGNVTLMTSGGAIALASEDSITTDSLDSSARSFVTVNVDAGGDNADGTIGDQLIRATGGEVALASVSGEVTLSEGSSIRSNVVSGDGDGGDIRIEGVSLQLTNNLLTTTVGGVGDAGDIIMDITNDVVIAGSRLLTGRESGADGAGAGGTIDITAASIELTDFAFLNTATFGTGDAGDVRLTTTRGDIALNDSSIFSLTAGDGSAGDIFVQSARALRLDGNSVVSTAVALGSTGEGGNIFIEAPDGVFVTGVGLRETESVVGTQPEINEVEPNDGGIVFEPTFDPTVPSQAVDAFFGLANNPNVLFSTEVPYVAIAAESGDGSFDVYSFEVAAVGTQITFDVDEAAAINPVTTLDPILRLYDEQGSELALNDNASVTLGAEGSASITDPYLTYIFNKPGTYYIRVSEFDAQLNSERSLVTDGSYALNVSRVDDFLVSSGITTQTRASGRSGDITINAPIIDIQNGGQVSTETLRDGQAGNITLQPFADQPDLTINIEGEGSQISGSTLNSGAGGDLILSAPGRIDLQGDGVLRVEATSSGAAGNVEISTPTLNLRDTLDVSSTATETALPSAQQGGNFSVNVSNLNLLGTGGLRSETAGAAAAGTLTLRPYENLGDLTVTFRDEAEISTSTSSTG